jgi:hypothetical protein
MTVMRSRGEHTSLTGLTVAWSTFLGSLVRLPHLLVGELLIGGAFPHLSGDSRRSLLTALQAIRWLDDGGLVTPDLAEFVADPSARQRLIRGVLERDAPFVIPLVERDVDPQTMFEAIREKGIDELLVPRVARWLVSACDFVGVPVGSRLRGLRSRIDAGRPRLRRSWRSDSPADIEFVDALVLRWIAELPPPAEKASVADLANWYRTFGSILERVYRVPPGGLARP